MNTRPAGLRDDVCCSYRDRNLESPLSKVQLWTDRVHVVLVKGACYQSLCELPAGGGPRECECLAQRLFLGKDPGDLAVLADHRGVHATGRERVTAGREQLDRLAQQGVHAFRVVAEEHSGGQHRQVGAGQAGAGASVGDLVPQLQGRVRSGRQRPPAPYCLPANPAHTEASKAKRQVMRGMRVQRQRGTVLPPLRGGSGLDPGAQHAGVGRVQLRALRGEQVSVDRLTQQGVTEGEDIAAAHENVRVQQRLHRRGVLVGA